MRDTQPAIETVAALTERLAVLLSAGVSPIAAWGYLDGIADETAARVVRAAADAAAEGRGVGAAIARVVRPKEVTASRSEPTEREVVARAGSSEQTKRATRWRWQRAARTPDRQSRRTRRTRLTSPDRQPRPSRSSRPSRRRGHARISEPDAWLALAAAWQVATEAGAPLAPSLRDFAAAFRQLGEMERERALALAAPAATARLVLALPVIGILFGSLLGFNTLQTLFATVPGWICIAIAGALLGAAWAWCKALVRRAEPRDTTPGLLLELMAVGMEGGGSIPRAQTLVGAASKRLRLDRVGEQQRIDGVLELAARAGVPAAELLRSEARTVRRTADADGRRRALELSVALMLPLGLCVLPSFLIVGVVPLLITVIGSTLGGF